MNQAIVRREPRMRASKKILRRLSLTHLTQVAASSARRTTASPGQRIAEAYIPSDGGSQLLSGFTASQSSSKTYSGPLPLGFLQQILHS
jgi:hypothetical protein